MIMFCKVLDKILRTLYLFEIGVNFSYEMHFLLEGTLKDLTLPYTFYSEWPLYRVHSGETLPLSVNYTPLWFIILYSTSSNETNFFMHLARKRDAKYA